MNLELEHEDVEFLKECLKYGEMYHDEHVQPHISPLLPHEIRLAYLQNHYYPTKAMYQKIRGKLNSLMETSYHPTVNRKKIHTHRPAS